MSTKYTVCGKALFAGIVTFILATGCANLTLAAEDTFSFSCDHTESQAVGGKWVTTGEGGTLKNAKGETIAQGDVTALAGFSAIKGNKDSSFVHSPKTKAITKESWATHEVEKPSLIELSGEGQWKLMDDSFVFLLDIAPTMTGVEVKLMLDESIARSSIIKLSQRKFSLFGHTITVDAGGGNVQFHLGKITDGENVTIETPTGKTVKFANR